MRKIRKKTKIVATIGPVSDSKEVMKKLIDNGLNIARLNFSHGDYNSHKQKIDILKELIDEGENIAIMLDTKGPEVRTGLFKDGFISFNKGDISRITVDDIIGDKKRFSVSYKGLYKDVKVGDILRLDDGRLSLRIIEKDNSNKELVLKALNSHTIKDRRNVVAPFSRLALPFVSKKDEEDIIFGCKNDVDFIATSFTRTPKDILDVRKVLEKEGNHHIQIIAKIENYEGYKNAASILEVADGLMVARGDLGVEVNPEEVPIIQKELVDLANKMGKIVIVATHMLDSMQNNPTPTRAEVSDVANAIYEGCDSIMLSGESASGNFPVESVAMERRIASRIESILDYHKLAEKGYQRTNGDHNDAIAYAVANAVLLSKVELIICFSKTGSTARRISYYRPKCPIISVCDDKKVVRSLCLNWGVYGYYLKKEPYNQKEIAIGIAKEYGLKKGSKIVITGGNGKGSTNFMMIEEIV